jgi:hypothetical protein
MVRLPRSGNGGLRKVRALARAYRAAVEQATAAIAAEVPSTDGGRRVQGLLAESGRKRVAGLRLLERSLAVAQRRARTRSERLSARVSKRATRLFGRAQKALTSAQDSDDAAFEALRALRAPAAPAGR